jgi:NADH dehydrogenase
VNVLAPEAELGVRPRYYEQEVHQMKVSLGPLHEAVGVNFIKGLAHNVDVLRRTVGYTDANGVETSIHYDKLVLATGSRLVRPAAVPGLEPLSMST